MIRNPKIRNRGVRLNDNGLNVVEAALLKQWTEEGIHKKLTRERKAQLMGLSIATSDKVLKGNIVDRATVLLAFNNLYIKWSDDYLATDSKEIADDQYSCHNPECFGDNLVQPPVTVPSPTIPVFRFGNLQWPKAGFLTLGFITLGLLALGLVVSPVRSSQRPLPSALLGQREFHAGRYTNAINIVTKLRTNATASDSTSGLIEILRLEGDILVSKGEYAQAKDRFEQALAIKQSLGIENTYASSFEAIADCQLHLEEPHKAINMFEKSLDLYSKAQDAVGILMAKRGIASAYIRLGKIQSGLSLLQMCRDTLLKCPESSRQGLEADLCGREAVAYSLLNSHQVAISLSERCLTYWRSKQHPRWVAICESQLGFIYRRSGNELQARQILENSKLTFSKLGDSKTMGMIEKELHLNP